MRICRGGHTSSLREKWGRPQLVGSFFSGKKNVNILKTTPTPSKNGSYGVKVGVRTPQKSEFVCYENRFVHHILCESPSISRDLYTIRPLILWRILGSYFLLTWEVGVVEIVFKMSTKIKLLGPETAQWRGGLRREGMVAEKFAPSLERSSSFGFDESNLGCPGNFGRRCQTPGGVQKVCAKKSLCAFFVIYLWSKVSVSPQFYSYNWPWEPPTRRVGVYHISTSLLLSSSFFCLPSSALVFLVSLCSLIAWSLKLAHQMRSSAENFCWQSFRSHSGTLSRLALKAENPAPRNQPFTKSIPRTETPRKARRNVF